MSDQALLSKLKRLGRDVRREGAARLAAWRPSIERASFVPAAENLAHYLALRAHDLRDLQVALSERGLSSLGRCEGHVLASLNAVTEALTRVADRPCGAFPAAGWRRARDVRLAGQSNEIFGRDPTGPRTRIMVTLGADAASDPAGIREMIAAGADCVRINCAHDDPETWSAIIRHTRTMARALRRDCRVLMDLAGPKVRIASVSGPGKVRLNRDDRFLLAGAGAEARSRGLITVTCSEPGAVRRLKHGQRVSIDDGRVGCIVEKRHRDKVELRVKQVRPEGVKIRAGKGLNFPDLDLDIPPLTDKDLADLDFVVEHADIVGYSFVQRPHDIVWLQRELAQRASGRLPPLIIKVETRLGVANLPELIIAAAGRQPTAVMIARGDLAVELGLQQLSETQEQLLWLCEAAYIPVVWATQVLDGLLKTGIPSRAEATDAAMGQRAECVMLNKGDHAVDAVRFLDNVLHRMDRHVAKKSPVLGPLALWIRARPPGRAVPSAPKRPVGATRMRAGMARKPAVGGR
ncbi:MAG: pyruvate kinase [Xanthobacteraceae bacterium]|nr:pyruvate kinase [Xanthobacteraceae bacterium]